MTSELYVVAEAISALAAVAVFYYTWKPLKASGVPYMLGIPAGFGLLALAFLINLVTVVINAYQVRGGLILSVIYFLLETYGILFLAMTYARRTRLKFIGESFSIELAIPALITVIVVAHALIFEDVALYFSAPPTMQFYLRVVMALALIYLVYETSRDWKLAHRSVEVPVIFAYTALLFEQIGFIMSIQWFPDVTTFIGYEGRILGLLLLLGISVVNVKRNDFATIIKRLGLAAPTH